MRLSNLIPAPILVAATLLLCLPDCASSAVLNGTVQSGGDLFKIPLSSVPVKLYAATTGAPIVVASVTTNAAGRFSITTQTTSTPGTFYVLADLGKSVQLVTVLGPQLPPSVTVNELTTVAAAYSMAQFYRTGVIQGSSLPLNIASMMNDNLVDIATGTPSPVLKNAPNADQTNSLRVTRSLANALAACTVNRALAAYFLTLTTPPGGTTPLNTPQGLANLARDPAMNVVAIYGLSKTWIPYVPGVLLAPDVWTVTVKVNNSGDDAFMFGGPASIAFDKNGYAWVTNNVIQGQPYSTRSFIVLKPNGQPSDGSNGTPVSPLKTGGIYGAGFGLAQDSDGNTWVGNFGWGGANPTSTGNGSVTQYSPTGSAISPLLAYQGGPVRVQGMEFDSRGNLWMASFGTDNAWVFQNGNPGTSFGTPVQYAGAQCFDVAIAADDTAWVVSGGGFTGTYQSNVSRYAFNNGQFTLLSSKNFPVGRAMKGVSVDSQGNAWVASQGDSKIYVFAPSGSLLASYGGNALTGGGIDGPWSTTVDGEDNIWVANFGPLKTGSNFTDGRVTKLAGANASTRPPGKKMGDPISPWSGYNVESAGSPVLLHNGDPLYGPGKLPSYAPLMRVTSVTIDRAGNLWACNNWKPDFDVDTGARGPGNPGGDGIVIFIGLAPPPNHMANTAPNPPTN